MKTDKPNDRNDKTLSGAPGVATFSANAPRPCPACGAPMTRGYATLRKTDRVTRKSWTYDAEVWVCESAGCGAGSHIGFPVEDVTGLRKLELKRRGGAPGGPTMAEEKRAGGWGDAHAACVECGTTARRHRGRGLCSSCYQRAARKAKREGRAAAAGVAPAVTPRGGSVSAGAPPAATAIGDAPAAATAIAGAPVTRVPERDAPEATPVDVVVRLPGCEEQRIRPTSQLSDDKLTKRLTGRKDTEITLTHSGSRRTFNGIGLKAENPGQQAAAF